MNLIRQPHLWKSEKQEETVLRESIQMRYEIPPFDDVLPLFREFLVKQGKSSQIVWVFREDITKSRNEYWILDGENATNFELARHYYDHARTTAEGISLEHICDLENRAVCYVFATRDALEASYAMLSGLHFKINQSPCETHLVKSTLLFQLRRAFNRVRGKQYFRESIPRQANVLRLKSRIHE